jgi:diguanylate cyclase (GGDEF)-like protein
MLISHDHRLVVLSIVIAVFASFVAFDLATRVTSSGRKAARYWLAGAAASMGIGIWSGHFIGMLALRVPLPVRHDAATASLSLLAAVATSGLALKIAGAGAVRWPRLVMAGSTMGAGIAAMHCIALGSIRPHAAVIHEPWLFAASFLVAIVASTAALTTSFQPAAGTARATFRSRFGGAALMGIAIVGMHYTAVNAAIVAPVGFELNAELRQQDVWLGGAIGAFVFVLLAATLLIAACDAHFRRRNSKYARRLRKANATLQAQAKELSQSNLLLQKEVEVRLQSEKQIAFLAHRDTLTGLPNRRLFSKTLTAEIRQGRRYSMQLAVLFIDLDRFKTVNDTMGHAVGDLLLQEISKRLSKCVREEDTLARLGGDEFVVLAKDINEPSCAAAIAERILEIVNKPLTVQGRLFHVTASIGISTYPKDGKNEQTLMRHADSAMYQAKEAGKNGFRFYSDRLDAEALDRLSLETSLRQALVNGEFALYYQPKVDLQTGRIVGVEALLRWEQPQLGSVPPSKFIPLAEETGLIGDIGKWVLETACRQGAQWHRVGYGSLGIAVNLSAHQLSDERLVEDISAIVTSTGISPDRLELEITESVLMRDVDKALAALHALKAMGIRVALDDFGTGYSSLAVLKQFPIDTLKIDGAFVKGLPAGHKENGIAEAIIAMGRSLELTVVAEAVETAEQAAFLRHRSCHQFQGYHFSEPLPALALETLLKRQAGAATLAG